MDTGGREREGKRADGRFEARLLVLGAMLECPACTGKTAYELERMLVELEERAREGGKRNLQRQLTRLRERVEELKELEQLKKTSRR